MTYNVFGRTLNLAQSVYLSRHHARAGIRYRIGFETWTPALHYTRRHASTVVVCCAAVKLGAVSQSVVTVNDVQPIWTRDNIATPR